MRSKNVIDLESSGDELELTGSSEEAVPIEASMPLP